MSTNNSSTIRARRRFASPDREFTVRGFCKDSKDVLCAGAKQSANVALTLLNATEQLLPEVENAAQGAVDVVHNVNVTIRVMNVHWADMNQELIHESGFNEADINDFSIPAWQVRKVVKKTSEKKPSRRRTTNKKAVAS